MVDDTLLMMSYSVAPPADSSPRWKALFVKQKQNGSVFSSPRSKRSASSSPSGTGSSNDGNVRSFHRSFREGNEQSIHSADTITTKPTSVGQRRNQRFRCTVGVSNTHMPTDTKPTAVVATGATVSTGTYTGTSSGTSTGSVTSTSIGTVTHTITGTSSGNVMNGDSDSVVIGDP